MFYALVLEKPVFFLANVTASCLAGRWDYVDLFIQSLICIHEKWKTSFLFFSQWNKNVCSAIVQTSRFFSGGQVVISMPGPIFELDVLMAEGIFRGKD